MNYSGYCQTLSTRWNYCPADGQKLEPHWNNCPACGAAIAFKQHSEPVSSYPQYYPFNDIHWDYTVYPMGPYTYGTYGTAGTTPLVSSTYSPTAMQAAQDRPNLLGTNTQTK